MKDSRFSRYFYIYIFIYILINLCPEYFNEIYVSAEPYSGAPLWNKLPLEIKCSGSVNSFKHNIKGYYLTKNGR